MDRTVYDACNDLVLEHGRPVSADEVLSDKLGNCVPVPFKTREELHQLSDVDRKQGVIHGDVVPRIDLRVLHYYATQLILAKYPQLMNTFDETCLITLGLLVEQWVEEFLKIDDDVSAQVANTVSKHIDYRLFPADI
ncbi:RNA polymerase I-specific transcription initiation factor RRN10 [Nakaseomyces bracarensis]|uniref:RNA polymerase I-specific transcription initiation factor RRN10 n=1 Tax=Nakaseomyces bracarensis TaxID=273131 RepID=A0ABR4NWB8_9SACH